MTTPPICDYEGSDYQETFWEQGGRDYEDGAEAVALRRLLPSKGELLLEVGAGAGRNTPRYGGYGCIVLLDYSVTQLKQAQARLGRNARYTYVAADANNLPFVDGLFDGATMIRVLHHMADGPRVLAQIRQVMQEGGTFILEYANKRNLKAIARFILRRQPWNPFDPAPVEFVPLNFNFHPKTTRQWLADAGFTVERQLTVSHFRVGLLKRLFPTKWLVAADALASLTGDLWQVSPSVFVKGQAKGTGGRGDGGTGRRGGAGMGGEGEEGRRGFFKCPQCGGRAFVESETALHCQGCGVDWRVEDGVYVFK